MRRLTTERFIEKAKCIHGDRYSYELVEYKNSKTKVNIKCTVHGAFDQSPFHHLNGSGCKKCGIIQAHNKQKKSTEQFIQDAIKVNNDKYDYSLVIYKGNKIKVKIICPEHGVFEQRPDSHLHGSGCQRCANNQQKSIEQFMQDAKEVHGDRYSYELVEYKNKDTKVKIICPEHGMFEQTPGNHLNKNNCPKCMNVKSKGEIELQEWLSQYVEIKTNDRSIIYPLELDIIIPSKKIAIEYNGLYWHSEQRGKDRYYHKNKYNLCKEKGYRLIQIWEDEWLFKKDIVKNRLKHILGKYDRIIYARKCIVKEIPPSQAKSFIDKYHIQGYTGSSTKLGLFYETKDDFGFDKEELVAVMTFAKPSISKGNKTNAGSFELSRFCSSCKVIGAGGKLLKHFIRNYDVSYILTYADLRWSNGDLYNAIGFDFISYTPVNYYYVIDGKRKHRFNYRKNVLKEKLEVFNPEITEYQNMINNNIDRVWDCGNLKFEMNL